MAQMNISDFNRKMLIDSILLQSASMVVTLEHGSLGGFIDTTVELPEQKKK